MKYSCIHVATKFQTSYSCTQYIDQSSDLLHCVGEYEQFRHRQIKSTPITSRCMKVVKISPVHSLRTTEFPATGSVDKEISVTIIAVKKIP